MRSEAERAVVGSWASQAGSRKGQVGSRDGQGYAKPVVRGSVGASGARCDVDAAIGLAGVAVLEGRRRDAESALADVAERASVGGAVVEGRAYAAMAVRTAGLVASARSQGLAWRGFQQTFGEAASSVEKSAGGFV